MYTANTTNVDHSAVASRASVAWANSSIQVSNSNAWKLLADICAMESHSYGFSETRPAMLIDKELAMLSLVHEEIRRNQSEWCGRGNLKTEYLIAVSSRTQESHIVQREQFV